MWDHRVLRCATYFHVRKAIRRDLLEWLKDYTKFLAVLLKHQKFCFPQLNHLGCRSFLRTVLPAARSLVLQCAAVPRCTERRPSRTQRVSGANADVQVEQVLPTSHWKRSCAAPPVLVFTRCTVFWLMSWLPSWWVKLGICRGIHKETWHLEWTWRAAVGKDLPSLPPPPELWMWKQQLA